MTGKDSRSAQALREQAEERLLKTAAAAAQDVDSLSPEGARKLLHELHVHQIELEMQNEELRDSQAAIEEAKARYFDLYDLAPVGYCMVSEAGLILQANLCAAALAGVNRAEMVGRPLSRFILREDQDTYYLRFKRLAGGEALPPCELRMVSPGGEQVWVQMAATIAPGGHRVSGFLVVLTDISERKQVGLRLANADALQTAISNSTTFSSIATDAKGVIQIFNVGAERMLGYTAAEAVNTLTPSDFSDAQELIERATALSKELKTPVAPGFEALAWKARRTLEDVYELTYIRKDGIRVPSVVSVTALRGPQDNIIGYLLIGTDNTARKQVEAERNEAVTLAQRASRAKSEFLSSMSHELRTPLNSILGFAQLLDAGTPPLSPTQKRITDRILKAGWFLLTLINEILDLAHIESGKLALSNEPVALASVLIECRAMIEAQAREGGIALSFPPLDTPYFLSADRTRLQQVLLNLLSNAVKYNRPGGSVKVECEAYGVDRLHISVSDTGQGLTKAQLGQLFQAFNRLGREADVKEGTGIGLVVTKQLVEMMGGRIHVESTVGVGARFRVDFRLSNVQELDPGLLEQAVAERAPQPEGGPVRTLLYVEDNPDNLDLIEYILRDRPDLRLLTAQEGQLGIELARKHQPALILMDINLPGISGTDTMKLLRADPATGHIPIIALSASAMPQEIENALTAGFSSYITKPFSVPELLDRLDAALRMAVTARGSRP